MVVAVFEKPTNRLKQNDGVLTELIVVSVNDLNGFAKSQNDFNETLKRCLKRFVKLLYGIHSVYEMVIYDRGVYLKGKTFPSLGFDYEKIGTMTTVAYGVSYTRTEDGIIRKDGPLLNWVIVQGSCQCCKGTRRLFCTNIWWPMFGYSEDGNLQNFKRGRRRSFSSHKGINESLTGWMLTILFPSELRCVNTFSMLDCGLWFVN